MLWKIFLSRHILRTYQTTWTSQPCLAIGGASDKEPACQYRSDVRDTGWIPGSARSPGGRRGNPLQYSCLENPMDKGAWQAAVHRVIQSLTRLRQLSMWARRRYNRISDLVILRGPSMTVAKFSGHKQESSSCPWKKKDVWLFLLPVWNSSFLSPPALTLIWMFFQLLPSFLGCLLQAPEQVGYSRGSCSGNQKL